MNSPSSTPRQGSLGKGYTLPLILLLLIIGGLAFYSQFWTNTRAPSGGKKEEQGALVCRFTTPQAVWGDPARGKNWNEIEKGNHGHYDFPFENPSDQKGELTLNDVNCACSGIKVALLPDEAWSQWQESRKNDGAVDAPGVSAWVRLLKGGESPKSVPVTAASETIQPAFELPPKAKGVLRVTWDGRGSPGSDLGLVPVLMARPVGGDIKSARVQSVRVALRMVWPVQFLYPPGGLKVARLGPQGQRSVEFFAWSATRSKASLEVTDDPPLLTVEQHPLSDKETKALQDRLHKEEKWATEVKVAWKITATLREEAEVGGKLIQHNMGPFHRAIPVAVDGVRMDGNTPVLTGSVASAIEVGEEKERGAVDLGPFDAKDRVRKQVFLWSDKSAELEYVSPAEFPGLKLNPRDAEDFKVKLIAEPEESTETRARWRLEVEVPPGTITGAFPETAAIYLRLKGTPPRLIRIPVQGTLRTSTK